MRPCPCSCLYGSAVERNGTSQNPLHCCTSRMDWALVKSSSNSVEASVHILTLPFLGLWPWASLSTAPVFLLLGLVKIFTFPQSFPRGLLVRTWRFHHCDLGSIPALGTEISYQTTAHHSWKIKKQKNPAMNSDVFKRKIFIVCPPPLFETHLFKEIKN